MATDLENINLTRDLFYELNQWNNSEKHTFLGPLGARTVGVIATPVACALDTIIHGALCIGKGVAGVVFTAYNFTASIITRLPKATKNKDHELSSAVVHLAHALDAFAHMFIFPFLIFMDPSRAHNYFYFISKEQQNEMQTLLSNPADKETNSPNMHKQPKASPKKDSKQPRTMFDRNPSWAHPREKDSSKTPYTKKPKLPFHSN